MLLSVTLRKEANISIAALQTGKYWGIQGFVDVFEYMMKLEKNLYLPDFALSLHVLVCQKKKKPNPTNQNQNIPTLMDFLVSCFSWSLAVCLGKHLYGSRVWMSLNKLEENAGVRRNLLFQI